MSIKLFEFQIGTIIRVTGEDALPYLQSQLTIDLRKLVIGGTRLGLRLSLKGKVLFGAQILRTQEEEFVLVCQGISSSRVIGLLEENVVADEVDFEEIPGHWKEYLLYHPTSVEECFRIIGPVSLGPGDAKTFADGWVYLNSRMPSNCLSILLPQNKPTPWFKNLPSPHPSELEQLRLKEGLFLPGLEIGKEEFPQEGELEKTAVDFDKGCYLGQEVMARIHAMGKVRKKAFAVRSSAPLQKTLPAGLFCNHKQIGSLKSQFLMPEEDDWIGTAVIHENAIENFLDEGLFIEDTQQTLHPLNWWTNKKKPFKR